MTKLSQEQLNNLSKEELVAETLKLQDQYIDRKHSTMST